MHSETCWCVVGLVAQQQCVGPLQLPISNVAVMAQSHFGLTGAATAIGEQPLKGLINPAAMARLCLGEALTNLVWAESTGLADIKASVNWMYAAKMASEGVAMYEAATALKQAMIELQVRRCLCVRPCQHPCPDVCLPREQRIITF